MSSLVSTSCSSSGESSIAKLPEYSMQASSQASRLITLALSSHLRYSCTQGACRLKYYSMESKFPAGPDTKLVFLDGTPSPHQVSDTNPRVPQSLDHEMGCMVYTHSGFHFECREFVPHSGPRVKLSPNSKRV